MGSGSSQTITVASGGSPPAASSRSLATDVYSQAVQINVTGANNSGTAITGANLTGNLGAWLDSPPNTNNNNWQQSLIHDGAAGRSWKVRCHMSATKTGSGHASLDATFYVAALTDASGNLGGLRILPIIEAPWCQNAPSNTPETIFAFQPAVQWQWGSGPTVVDMVSVGTFPFVSQTFTVTAGQAATTATNNFWQGAFEGPNYITAYVTNSGGALPGGLTANHLYAIASNQYGGANNNLTFYDGTTPNSPAITLTSSGSGTNTIVPVNYVSAFSRLPMPTAGGRWNEFQGTGSGNTGSSVGLQTQIDHSYWHSTKVIPPYDLSILGSVTDNSWNFSYTPVSIGPWTWTGGTGERPELGILPNEHVAHFYTQSATSDKLVRVSGYAGNLNIYNLRDYTTGQVCNLDNATYTGLPAWTGTTSNIQIWGGLGSTPYGFGITVPSVWLAPEDQTTDHKPCPAAWPYLFTGEPQYYDIVLDLGVGAILQVPGSDANHYERNPTLPSSYYGLITVVGAQMRLSAWGNRDIQWAAALCPKPFYDGSQLWNMLDKVASANAAYPNALMGSGNNGFGTSTAYLTANGMWLMSSPDLQAVGFISGGFEHGYFTMSMCLAASARGDANALAWLQTQSTRLNHLAANGDWHLYSYYDYTGAFQENQGNILNAWGAGTPVQDDAHWGITCNSGPPGICNALQWTNTGSPYFQWTPNTDQSQSGFVPTNNDKLVVQGDSAAPSVMSYYTPYYAWNVSGNNFDLFTAPSGGGTRLTPTDTGFFTPHSVFIVAAAPPGPSTGQVPTNGSIGQPDGYCANVNFGMRWMIALGITGLTTLEGNCRTRLTQGSYAANVLNEPKYDAQASF